MWGTCVLGNTERHQDHLLGSQMKHDVDPEQARLYSAKVFVNIKHLSKSLSAPKGKKSVRDSALFT